MYLPQRPSTRPGATTLRNALLPASILLSLALAGAGLALHFGGSPGPAAERSSERRLAALEDRIARLESGLPPGAPSPGGVPLPKDSPDPGPGAGASPVPGIAPLASRDAPEPLRALVREVLDEEIRRREAEGTGRPGESEPGKPPLSRFAAELDLSDSQREGVRMAVVKGQEEMIALLRTPTAGGRVPLDDLLGVLMGKPEEAQPRMVEIFGMLASEPVPGGEETYARRLEGLKKDAVETFRREFTPEQFKAFEKTGQDPLEIQVPDSPWIGILQEAWRRGR